MHEAVCGRVRDAKSVEAAREALATVFHHFVLVRLDAELAALAAAGDNGVASGDYWLMPVEREEFVLAWGVEPYREVEIGDGTGDTALVGEVAPGARDLTPVLRKVPLHIAGGKPTASG